MRSAAVLLVLATTLGLVLCSRPAQSQDKQIESHDASINKLLVERRDTLRQLVDAVKTKHRSGAATLEVVLRAQDELLDAELELANTRKQRVSIHENRVKNLRELEKVVDAKYRAGAVTAEMKLATKATRLKAEIELLREKSIAN